MTSYVYNKTKLFIIGFLFATSVSAANHDETDEFHYSTQHSEEFSQTANEVKDFLFLFGRQIAVEALNAVAEEKITDYKHKRELKRQKKAYRLMERFQY